MNMGGGVRGEGEYSTMTVMNHSIIIYPYTDHRPFYSHSLT